MTADAGTETGTGMIPAEEDSIRSRLPEALADVRKKNPDPNVFRCLQ